MRLGNADTVLSKLRSPISSDAPLASEPHSTNASYLLASATRGKHCPSAALALPPPSLFALAVNLIVCLSWRRLPFSIPPPFHSNIINTFHSCQSKKLKLTYIKALHPSYISRSRMDRGGRAKINVPECFAECVCVCECVHVCVSVCTPAKRGRN